MPQSVSMCHCNGARLAVEGPAFPHNKPGRGSCRERFTCRKKTSAQNEGLQVAGRSLIFGYKERFDSFLHNTWICNGGNESFLFGAKEKMEDTRLLCQKEKTGPCQGNTAHSKGEGDGSGMLPRLRHQKNPAESGHWSIHPSILFHTVEGQQAEHRGQSLSLMMAPPALVFRGRLSLNVKVAFRVTPLLGAMLGTSWIRT